MKWSEIKKLNKELKKNLKGNIKEIIILSNVTTNSLKEILELELRKENINANVTIGNFDSIVTDSVKYSSSDAVIIYWEMANLVPDISDNYFSFSAREIEEIVEQKINEIEETFKNLEKVPLVLFNKFSSFKFDKSPLISSGASVISNHLNAFIENKKNKNTFLIDLDKIFYLLKNPINERQFSLTSELYTEEFYFKYSENIKFLFMSLYGKSKKVLILDCDNTLWGGILGEEGENNIQLGKDNIEGKIYLSVQKIVKNLMNKGALIALCSKNNLEDVDLVFSKNKNMILENKDIIIKKINWKDKASNIKEISEELNLSLDSFVFVDDSNFEIGLVNKELPEVKTILVPENLEDYPSCMQSLELDFFKLSFSSEDKKRTSLYFEEESRKKFKKSYNSIRDYLASLNLKLKIHKQNEVLVSRAAQMSQKTNQFNLTTKRYAQEDIQEFINDSLARVFTFELSDKFGDYGITGLSICKINKEDKITAEIDTFLMSCRVIGRDIEKVFLEEVIKELFKEGASIIKASYEETLKNGQVANFYLDMGFDKSQKSNQFYLKKENFKSKKINYIELI